MGFKMPLAKETVTPIAFGGRLGLCIRLRTFKDYCRRRCLQVWLSSDGIRDGILSISCFCGSVGLVLERLRYFGNTCTAQSDGANDHEAKNMERLFSPILGLFTCVKVNRHRAGVTINTS